MDPTTLPLDPRQLAGPVAALAAAGSAVTVLTEVAKQYSERLPPPLIAALIAALFTGAFSASSTEVLTRQDAFPILMTWFGLFQISIGVYHGAKLAFSKSQQAQLDDAVAEATQLMRESYDARLAAKEEQLQHARDTEILRVAQPVPMTVPASVPSPETNPNVALGGR